MGLIPCPDCGRTISDKAAKQYVPVCPECYRPFDLEEWKRIDARRDSDAQAAEMEERDAEEKAKKAQKEGQRTIIVSSGNPSHSIKTKR